MKRKTTKTATVGKRSPAASTAECQPCSDWYECPRWSGGRAKVVTLATTPPIKTPADTLADAMSDWHTRTLEASSQIRLAHAGMAGFIESIKPTPEDESAAYAAWELLDTVAKNLEMLTSALDTAMNNAALMAMGGGR